MAVSTNFLLSSSSQLIDAIVKVLEVQTYEPEDYIVTQGDISN